VLSKSIPPAGFTVKAFYTIPELAKMAGMSRERMQRLLERNEVRLKRSGRHFLVPLSEINDKMFWLRDSMEMRDIYRDSLAGQVPSR